MKFVFDLKSLTQCFEGSSDTGRQDLLAELREQHHRKRARAGEEPLKDEASASERAFGPFHPDGQNGAGQRAHI